MHEEKKGLSWFRLILLQLVIGCTLIGIFAYVFRIGVDEVNIVAQEQQNHELFVGVPMRMNVTYPGIGTITIEDPKELIAWKESFARLLSSGSQENRPDTRRLVLSGSISYLDQEDIPFQINTSGFRFGSEWVNSLDISADIRKLQNMLIDKTLTADTVGVAIASTQHEVYSLVKGKLNPLTSDKRSMLTAQMRTAVRLIDFNHFDFNDSPPSAHYVVELVEEAGGRKHWLHIDQYDNAYFVVFDLLDETNHKAYFKFNNASNIPEGQVDRNG
ncbi:DUF3919 family protein [Paenibacillus sp. N1-5-1-14]|uniref:DUF3919 family protein n=1 Tax=Paenibacillus radicibacter TaxID=2972488 RepID=UPI0021592F1F|nr:DUF3919 family protein [Paenibacillus radicibacter]MCR8644366.1 DUF3919 family protein [Paenibacillus radicibacter]